MTIQRRPALAAMLGLAAQLRPGGALAAQPSQPWTSEASPNDSGARSAPAGTVVRWPALRQIDGQLLPPEAWQDTAAILVFWATWCPYCREHNVHVQRLHEQGLPRGVRLQTFAIDGTPDSVGAYMRTRGWRFPTSLDAAPMRSQLALRKTVPTTCTVDAQARLRQVIPGEMLPEDFLDLPRTLVSRTG